MPIEKVPAFILENKYFDKLKTPVQISLYAMIERLSYHGIPFSYDLLERWANDIGIKKKQFKDAMEALVKIGFLTKTL